MGNVFPLFFLLVFQIVSFSVGGVDLWNQLLESGVEFHGISLKMGRTVRVRWFSWLIYKVQHRLLVLVSFVYMYASHSCINAWVSLYYLQYRFYHHCYYYLFYVLCGNGSTILFCKFIRLFSVNESNVFIGATTVYLNLPIRMLMTFQCNPTRPSSPSIRSWRQRVSVGADMRPLPPSR